MNLEKYIRNIPDFPKKGVSYKDITPLLLAPEAVEFCVQRLVEKLPKIEIHKVVGIESRGFFFATLLANRLGAGFVPIRKEGKLPYATAQQTYALEYGSDVLEIHQDAIKKNENVLIHDDVLATGGTASAACKLVEGLGGKVVQCDFLMELSFLHGRKKIEGHEVECLLNY